MEGGYLKPGTENFHNTIACNLNECIKDHGRLDLNCYKAEVK